jgi:hypothetical protein
MKPWVFLKSAELPGFTDPIERVGAANRADNHKLRLLEEQKAALEEKLARILFPEAGIRELSATLPARIDRQSEGEVRDGDSAIELAALHRLIADLGVIPW